MGGRCGATHAEYEFAYWQYPKCEVMWDLESGQYSLKDFLRVAPYAPHGSIHALIGGAFECSAEFDALRDALELNVTVVNQWRSIIFNGLKDMFRSGYLEFPESCDSSTPYAECASRCANLDSYVAANNSAMLEEYLGLIDFWGFLDDRPWDDRVRALKILCDAGLNVLGDQLEASSPNDVAFWPIHPTVDRLFQWKYIAGTLTNLEWPATEYYWGTYGANTLNVSGHRGDDTLPYDLPQLGLKADQYTNRDFLNLSIPDQPTMPYVYHHFHWDHCKNLGFDIGNATALRQQANKDATTDNQPIGGKVPIV